MRFGEHAKSSAQVCSCRLENRGWKVKGSLNRVLHRANSLLELQVAVELDQLGRNGFGLRAQNFQLVGGARLELSGDRIAALRLGFSQQTKRGRGLLGDVEHLRRAIDLGQDSGLERDKPGGGFFAPPFGFGDGSLVLVENRQVHDDAERPLAVPLIVLIAG